MDISKLAASGRPCYFISPHYDDGVFSAGALMLHLAKTNPVTVINVFTQAGERPYSLSAKAYLRQCGYTDARALYADRTAEDKRALSAVTTDVIDLGFTEALWRRPAGRARHLLGKVAPELANSYPTYRFHAVKGKIARSDHRTVQAVSDALRRLVPADAQVFCPQAIGGHVDHLATKLACEQTFERIIEWSDYPYNEQARDLAPAVNFTGDVKAKDAMMSAYVSQYQTMFGEQAVPRAESFIVR